MDLRRKLIRTLGLILAGLLAAALLVEIYALKGDMDTEVTASSRLVQVLLAASQPASVGEDRFARLLADARLRHLSIRLAGLPGPEFEDAPLLRLLGLAPAGTKEQEIHVGDRTLFIAPNPRSEIGERLSDAVQFMITLMVYSAATLLVVWWSADRALRPVRALEEGLKRLAEGRDDPALPAFELKEFSRVAGAIEQLAQALAEARAAQSALARELIAVQESERRSLARDLHDEMGQTLTSLNATAAFLQRNAAKLDIPAIEECAADLRRDIGTSGNQLRAMLKSLRPHGLTASELGEMLLELVEGWKGRATGIEFSCRLPAAFAELEDEAALTIYRVVQEALTNVVRHSGASRCFIEVTQQARSVELRIGDDGKGVPDHGPARRGGLLGMAERVSMVGGTLEIRKRSGDGLLLLASIPVGDAPTGARLQESCS